MKTRFPHRFAVLPPTRYSKEYQIYNLICDSNTYGIIWSPRVSVRQDVESEMFRVYLKPSPLGPSGCWKPSPLQKPSYTSPSYTSPSYTSPWLRHADTSRYFKCSAIDDGSCADWHHRRWSLSRPGPITNLSISIINGCHSSMATECCCSFVSGDTMSIRHQHAMV